MSLADLAQIAGGLLVLVGVIGAYIAIKTLNAHQSPPPGRAREPEPAQSNDMEEA